MNTKKTVAKKLSAAHKAAIAAAMRNPINRLVSESPAEAMAVIARSLVQSIKAEHIAAAAGVSRTALYRDVIPGLGCSTADELRDKLLSHNLGKTPAVPLFWWLTPLSEADDGRKTAMAACAQGSADQYECRIAASLYWHCWASKRNPWGHLGDGPHCVHFLDPVGTLFGILTDVGATGVPTDDKLRSAPRALIDFAAYVAEECLFEDRRKGQEAIEGVRHKTACRRLTKLVELGFESAAHALVSSAVRTPSLETAHDLIVTARAMMDRDGYCRMHEGLKQETTVPTMSEGIYKILSALAIGIDAP
jgi:hypothetical protein